MKKNIQAGIDKLKAMPGMREIPPFGKIYDALREMEIATAGPLPGEDEQWEKDFVEKEGTRDAFIKEKTEQWQRQHRKGGNQNV